MNAPLINRANPDVTPNPSKAPWYFLNLQELLLHMNPALAGVVVPTVVADRPGRGALPRPQQGGPGHLVRHANSVAITVCSRPSSRLSAPLMLILFDSGKHAQLYEKITGRSDAGPVGARTAPGWLPDVGIITAIWDLVFIRNFRAIQTEWTWKTDLGGLVPHASGPNGHDGTLDWPEDFTRIPIPFNGTSWPWHGGAPRRAAAAVVPGPAGLAHGPLPVRPQPQPAGLPGRDPHPDDADGRRCRRS